MTLLPAPDRGPVDSIGDLLKILLVDDLEADRLLIRRALGRAQGVYRFEIVEAETMAGALAALAQNPPDVVLLDLMLPDSRGADTVASIRLATPAAIVVLTVNTDSQVALESLGIGAHEYLLKSELRTHPLDRAITFAVERQRLERGLERAHRQQNELQKQLLETQKMEAVGQLAGGVAHDFNNLLTIILGHAAMLRELEAAPQKVSQLDEIAQAAERASALTRQLLAFGSRQAHQPEFVDVNQLLVRLQPMMAGLLGEASVLDVQLCSAPVMAWIDPRQLEQVVLNLVLNARDALKGGGKVLLQTAVRGLSAAQLPSGLSDGFYVILTVRDTGVGIAPAILPRIFEPFFTTKPTGEGSGLGLSAVYGIVHQAGGMVRALSEPDQGTSVEVYLPVQNVAQENGERSVATLKTAVANILVVDDEAGVRNVVAAALRRAGHSVMTADNGQSALALIQGRERSIDLVISDVIMPEMGGPEFVKRLLAICHDLPILFISGYSDQALKRQGTLPTGSELLQKPFSLQDLLGRVDALLNKGR